MEVTCSTETSVDFEWIQFRYNPDERTLKFRGYLGEE
jgi:hypothetical protein